MNFRRSMFAAFCVAALCLTTACKKKIDGSSVDKFYQSLGEVQKRVPSERQDEFSNGMELILFFAPDMTNAISDMNGKTAEDLFEMIQQLRDSKPRIDASRKEKFAASFNEVLKSVPPTGAREALRSQMTQYGFFPWNSKNEAKIRSLDGKNAFEINKIISDIRRDEDPTKMNN